MGYGEGVVEQIIKKTQEFICNCFIHIKVEIMDRSSCSVLLNAWDSGGYLISILIEWINFTHFNLSYEVVLHTLFHFWVSQHHHEVGRMGG